MHRKDLRENRRVTTERCLMQWYEDYRMTRRSKASERIDVQFGACTSRIGMCLTVRYLLARRVVPRLASASSVTTNLM